MNGIMSNEAMIEAFFRIRPSIRQPKQIKAITESIKPKKAIKKELLANPLCYPVYYIQLDPDIPTPKHQGKREYYKKVWDISNSQDIHTLPNHDKRGFHDHHLDHIFPISKGFKQGIPPETIGHIDNLRFIPWLDNFSKSAKAPTKLSDWFK